MKTVSVICLYSFFVITFISCQSNKEISEDKNISMGDNTMTSLDWAGKYEGILPCAGCEGIHTLLQLNNDLTYSMKTKYLGKGDQIFKSSGKFSWDKDGRTIVLNNNDNNLGAKYYWVGENKVTQLDLDGNLITGELAEKYILRKIDSQITEKYWKLVELRGKKVQHNEWNKREPHMILKAENNSVRGNGGCNTFNGSYELKEGNRISFSKIASTLMACENMKAEREFFNVLEIADNYNLFGDTLTLNKAKMVPLARFEAVYFK